MRITGRAVLDLGIVRNSARAARIAVAAALIGAVGGALCATPLAAQQAGTGAGGAAGADLAAARAVSSALAAVNGGPGVGTATGPAASARQGALAGLTLPPITPPAPRPARQPAIRRPGVRIPAAPRATAPQASATGTTAPPTAAPAGAPTAPGGAPAPAPSAGTADAMVTRLAPQMDLRVGKSDGGLHLSGTVGIVIMLGLLTLLPTLLLLMTGFTRILIVLHFLRQALGTQNGPPAQLIAALSLLLTGFVMAPTLAKVNETALQPWLDGRMEQVEMLRTAVVPFRQFMLEHTRDHDLQVFLDMSAGPQPATENDIPLVTLMSAFATSELRTAFQIGFALFLPFIIIDIVVSSVLMSMGMFMLPPAMISLPFKLLLFVLVDGWTLVVQSLVTSFRT